MTAKQLRAKHRATKRNGKIQKVKNGICFLVMVILIFGFVELGFRAWDSELDSHSEYNRQYLEEMEMERLGN